MADCTSVSPMRICFEIPGLETSILSLKSPNTTDFATTRASEVLEALLRYNEITPFSYFHRSTGVFLGDGIIKRFAPSFNVSQHQSVLVNVADQVRVEDIFARD